MEKKKKVEEKEKVGEAGEVEMTDVKEEERPPILVAIDCEMVETKTDDSKLVRVSVVEYNWTTDQITTIYDEVVKPGELVVDYRFQFHGLKPHEVSSPPLSSPPPRLDPPPPMAHISSLTSLSLSFACRLRVPRSLSRRHRSRSSGLFPGRRILWATRWTRI